MNMTKYTRAGAAFGVALLFSTSAIAMDQKSPAELEDDTYVTLSGTVGNIVDSDEFELVYSGGRIMVDTNDKWPALFVRDANEVLNTGDRVQVQGEIDDNFFAKKEIDATRIVHGNSTSYRVYSLNNNMVDPEAYTYVLGEEGESVAVTGNVMRVMDDQKFVLNYDSGTIQVDADDIAMSKTDRLTVGDRVTVYGQIDNDWFEKHEIDADRIVEINSYPELAMRQ